MKILIACEFSGIVRDAFTALGHDATSCDLLPTEKPGKHIQGDVLEILNDGWDMMIAHPPCTHLTCSGARWFEQKRKDGRQQEGINFFMLFTNTNIPKVAIENPIGIMSTIYRKPSQIIHPYYFGDEFQKTTCLWLKNLPKLKHFAKTDLFDEATHVGRGDMVTFSSGKRMAKWIADSFHKKEGQKIRSKTFPGIAAAMAQQWGGEVNSKLLNTA